MKQRKILSKQRGMTMLSWFIVIAIGIFFALVAIKMVPSYLENYSIKQVLATIENDRQVRDMSPREIKNAIMKRLKVNSVYEFDRDWIEVKKVKAGTQINVVYEIRKPVAGNVSVVMEFAESVLIPPS
jgi:hypothetical protein